MKDIIPYLTPKQTKCKDKKLAGEWKEAVKMANQIMKREMTIEGEWELSRS
jgi:hypothetical protein